MRSACIAALVLSLIAAGLFLLPPSGKCDQKFQQSNKATVVFGVS